MKVAVVGATGMVGQKMLEVLAERNFPVTELIPVATEKNVGKPLSFSNSSYTIHSMEQAIAAQPHIALFSAGGATSLEWAPQFASAGCTVIDNSSAWRMDANTPLVVPEVNAHVLTTQHKIIANPNCSTIQMVVALQPLHKKYGIKRVVVSTYQSVSGSGVKAVAQLHSERQGLVPDMAYKHTIDLNVIPQIDVFTPSGYTKEELKMINETRKILGDDAIAVTATTVRVPVIAGHSESVNIELHNPYELNDVIALWQSSEGIIVKNDIDNFDYPMPLHAANTDAVYIGRIRRDDSQPNTLNCWIVADNLRKGAATNAVQIAEYLASHKLIQA